MNKSILAFSILCTVLNCAHAALTDGLVHHWNFDEGPDWHDSAFKAACTNTFAEDSVSDARANFVNMGSANWVAGRQFTGLEFNGVDEYLSVPSGLSDAMGGSASLSLWIKTSQTGGKSAASAPGIMGTSGAGSLQWGWLDETGRIALSADNVILACSAGPVNDNQWHHIVLTRDGGTGAGRIYVDGTLSGTGTGAAGNQRGVFASIGRIEDGGSGRYLAGRLDQIHIFNRVITQSEVAILRTNHAPKAWDVSTEGVNNRPFDTASIFSRTYDVERDPVAVTRWEAPANGTVAYNGDGSFTYTAKAGFVGNDRFGVTVSDSNGGFHRASIRVSVMSEPSGGGGVPVTQFNDFRVIQAGGVDLDLSGWRIPRILDWNKDGKPDLLVGNGGYIWRYMNTGTASSPAFAAGVKVQAGGSDIYAGTSSSPFTFADMTGDGVLDLVVADNSSKLRVYRNTAAAGATPVFAAAVMVKNGSGADFILPDKRFDLGDWNGDGKVDLITGTYSGDVKLFLNTGTAMDPRFTSSTALFGGSYQIYPRLYDLNGNGMMDLLRGINWGDIVYWRDAGSRGLANGATLSIASPDGSSPDLHGLTDGAIVDFGDFNGDGRVDLVVGGHSGNRIFLAYGVMKSAGESIAGIEAIYDANPTAPGIALSANSNELLNKVNDANRNLISRIQNGTLGTREEVFRVLTNHVAKYPFLKYQRLDKTNYHHVPSIVCQNWVMLQYCLADTPARRTNIANVMGLSGTMRTLYLEQGLALGDNAESIPAAYGTIRDFLRRHPRELFPDAILTIDQLNGDGRGGFIWTPNSTKNTFGDWAIGSANEWAGDLTSAIEKVLGTGAASGDYFTFVTGHEVTHSLDGYVNSRVNADLRKRWGLMLSTAAGPDVIAGADGWYSWSLTKSNFQAKGLWDGVEANWNAAWSNYWAIGAGAKFRNQSFMRGNIDWFMGSSQESLATQANHHWANGPGRLIGAVDRFRRAAAPGMGPLKANINEVVTFIDFISGGMNKVNLVETKYQASPEQVNWLDHYAELERDDSGYIRQLTVDGRRYLFEAQTNGVVTNVITSLLKPANDTAWTFRNAPRQVDVLSNDSRLEGGPVVLSGVSQPAHGTVTTNVDGTVNYAPAADYIGNDSFTYTITSSAGGSALGTVAMEVINNSVAPSGPLLVEYWTGIGGASVSDLTGNARFPASPNLKYYTNSGFELRSNYAEGYGTRCRAQLVPNVSGDYTFWIASDDGGELWLSPDGNEKNSALIAYTTQWAGPRQWTKYGTQQSAPVTLLAGQRYFIQSLHKEGDGGDNLAIGWAGPPPFNTTNVIPVANLRPFYDGFSAPVFTVKPIPAAEAVAGKAYDASIADKVTDNNAGETLRFVKISGPGWISVDSAGALSGVPSLADAGTNTLLVRVTDASGFFDEARVNIQVSTPVPPQILAGASLVDGEFGFQFSGEPGQTCQVEYTPCLPPTNGWRVVLQTEPLTSSPVSISIPVTNEAGFFRVGLLP